MGRVQTTPEFGSDAILGALPGDWFGSEAVDGDALPWLRAAIGSTYTRRATPTAEPQVFIKRANEGRDDDWGLAGGVGVLQQRVSFADFTDGGSTSGTLVLNGVIPAGALVYRTTLFNLTGFTGDSSATIVVGDGTDGDRYNTSTPSVFSNAVQLDVGAVSGAAVHVAAVDTVTITITSATDWGAVAAGAFTIRIYYFL